MESSSKPSFYKPINLTIDMLRVLLYQDNADILHRHAIVLARRWFLAGGLTQNRNAYLGPMKKAIDGLLFSFKGHMTASRTRRTKTRADPDDKPRYYFLITEPKYSDSRDIFQIGILVAVFEIGSSYKIC